MMTVFEYTNKGCRESNQDYVKSCPLSEGAAIYVVADGMGGYTYGDEAAKVVTEAIIDFVAEHVGKMSPGQLLIGAYKFANESLNIKRMSLNAKEMGCVAVTLFISDGIAYLAWLGDSRIYIFRNGTEVYHTEDHSMIAELSKIKSLSLDELEKYSSVVTRAFMGDSEDVIPSLMKTPLERDDTLILCSDGLYKQWPMGDLVSKSDHEIEERLNGASNLMDDNYSIIKIVV